MKVSEAVAALTGHEPDGPLFLMFRQLDVAPDQLFVVESVVKEAGMVPLLMGRRIQSQAARNSIFSEALAQRAFEAHMRGEPLRHSGTINRSEDGRYRITLDGRPIQEGFDTEIEARGFLRGFSLGFESGAAEKGEMTTT